MQIGIVGGTGKEGRGLALRWARAGHGVMIGSRDAERGRATASELTSLGFGVVTGGGLGACVEGADLVVVAVPHGGALETLRPLKTLLAGKVVLDITVPLAPPKVREVHLPPGQSAAMEVQALLGPEARVVAGLHHIGSKDLSQVTSPLDADVLVCGDDREAVDLVLALITALPARGLHAGPLRNAIALESMTPVLLFLNHRYGAVNAGLRVTGLPLSPPPAHRD